MLVWQVKNYNGATINVQDTSTFANDGIVSSVIVDVTHTRVVPSLGAPHASLWRDLSQEQLRSLEQYIPNVVFCWVYDNVPILLSLCDTGLRAPYLWSCYVLCRRLLTRQEVLVWQVENKNGGTINVQDTSTFVNNHTVSSVIVDVTNTRVLPSLGNRHTTSISLAGPQPRTAALI